jgi:hypothetical protein
MHNNIYVECANLVDFPCDILVLKHAQGFYGADAKVASLLKGKGQNRDEISPLPDDYIFIEPQDKLLAREILFLGVVSLHEFEYEQIREFARRTIEILRQHKPDVKRVAMTVHGVGYGLDEREAFLALLAGLFDAFREGLTADALERITIIEKNPGRAERLQAILAQYLTALSMPENFDQVDLKAAERSLESVGRESSAKPHIFVAMPFSDAMEDIYFFGIQGTVNAAGYLCERVDMDRFTGDILARIKERIETAALVIADLSGSNPNVYLEVGYAWGKGRPTLLLSQNLEDLTFDVKSQRCICYKTIRELAKKLAADLSAMKDSLLKSL